MCHPFDDFKKKKEYLVCIDSDGCAIDSMDIKHFACFGPCMIREWNLGEYEKELLRRWNEINLYSMTRGINRFKGLAMMLSEVSKIVAAIEDLDALSEWLEGSDELSNEALKEALLKKPSICLKKALRWSMDVNSAIKNLPAGEIKPFPGVADAVSQLHTFCDVAIVSSANYEAVKEEWARFGLLSHVDIVLAQNSGSKKRCIQKLLSCGYDPRKVMMIGDAPGDLEAASHNGVFYYPILVNNEEESWRALETACSHLREGTFSGEYQKRLIQNFIDNLS